MAKVEPPEMTILVDSREQCPWGFTTIKPVPTIITKGLKTGDYAIEGMEESGCCVERKSLSDLFGSCGKGRVRLESEFERMSHFDYAAIIIERSLGHIIKHPPENSKMLPKSVINTILSWNIKYKVQVYFVEDRILAEKICFNLFRHFYRQEMERI